MPYQFKMNERLGDPCPSSPRCACPKMTISTHITKEESRRGWRDMLRWHSRKIPQDELNFMADVRPSKHDIHSLSHDVRSANLVQQY